MRMYVSMYTHHITCMCTQMRTGAVSQMNVRGRSGSSSGTLDVGARSFVDLRMMEKSADPLGLVSSAAIFLGAFVVRQAAPRSESRFLRPPRRHTSPRAPSAGAFAKSRRLAGIGPTPCGWQPSSPLRWSVASLRQPQEGSVSRPSRTASRAARPEGFAVGFPIHRCSKEDQRRHSGRRRCLVALRRGPPPTASLPLHR